MSKTEIHFAYPNAGEDNCHICAWEAKHLGEAVPPFPGGYYIQNLVSKHGRTFTVSAVYCYDCYESLVDAIKEKHGLVEGVAAASVAG